VNGAILFANIISKRDNRDGNSLSAVLKRRLHSSRALLLLVAAALFLGLVGPYGTASEPLPSRLAFWLATVLSGGAVGRAIDAWLRRTLPSGWARVLVTAMVATPPLAAVTLGAMVVLLGHRHSLLSPVTANLLWQVFVINLAVFALARLVQPGRSEVVRLRTVFAPPLPEREQKFRQRLSAKRRYAKLIAVEAHDHYVRVHTDLGSELLTMRFSEAMEELEGAYGYRVHRSWWVAAEAIRKASWKRGGGQVQLDGDLLVPVSRSGAPVLRDSGWI
jgi:hypothetical protein